MTAMTIQRGFRFNLHPTAGQSVAFDTISSVVRLVYNLAFEQRRDHWRRYKANTGKTISFASQSRELTELRAEFDWIAEVPCVAQQQALRDLDKSFQSYFSKSSGHPRPRKKGRDESFRITGRDLNLRRLNSKWSEVKIPKVGWIKFRKTREVLGAINNATVTRTLSGWSICFSCELNYVKKIKPSIRSVGIDRGITNTLALSTGELLSLPKSIDDFDKKRRRAQSSIRRKTVGSSRYAKARKHAANLYAKQARIRMDWHHKISFRLAEEFGAVVLEDLRIKSMSASAKGTLLSPGKNVRQKAGLNRGILKQGWNIFERLLNYKLEERGGKLYKVPAPYTSQTCSSCGVVDKENRKSQAVFKCLKCGHSDNADINAAVNILRRNTSYKVVEDGHLPSGEAITRSGEITLRKPSQIGKGMLRGTEQ